jgi:hypothetical protein
MTFEEWAKNSKWNFDSSEYAKEIKEIAKAAWEAAQSQWRPIETAPKTKTILLLTEYEDVISGEWSFEDRDDPGQWFGWQEPLDQKVTHWMPLPQPPQEQQQ